MKITIQWKKLNCNENTPNGKHLQILHRIISKMPNGGDRKDRIIYGRNDGKECHPIYAERFIEDAQSAQTTN